MRRCAECARQNLRVQLIKRTQQDAGGKLHIQNKHLCFKYIRLLKLLLLLFVSQKAGKRVFFFDQMVKTDACANEQGTSASPR